MLNTAIYFLVFAGAALMIFNIYGFVRFAGFVRKQPSSKPIEPDKLFEAMKRLRIEG